MRRLIIQAHSSNIIVVKYKGVEQTQTHLELLFRKPNAIDRPTKLLFKLDKEDASTDKTDLELLCNSLCTGTVLCHLVNILDTRSADIVPWEPNYLDLPGMSLGVATGALLDTRDGSMQIAAKVPGATVGAQVGLKALQSEKVSGVIGAPRTISKHTNKSKVGRFVNRAFGLAGYKQNIQVPSRARIYGYTRRCGIILNRVCAVRHSEVTLLT